MKERKGGRAFFRSNKNEQEADFKTLKDIFFIFLKIGAFTFGGGYAMIPLIEEEVVHKDRKSVV